MTVRFERTTELAAAITDAFDVSLDVDIHMKSFEDSGERAIGGVQAGGMVLGDDVTWRARHFGIWWTMTSTITEFDRPNMFVDEQKKGPFKRFVHRHTFVDNGDGTTKMTDTIEFDAPLGPLGRIAERVALRRYLPILIDKRNDELRSHFATRG